MNTSQTYTYSDDVTVGNKTFCSILTPFREALIYCYGSQGRSLCFSMSVTKSTGNIKVRSPGNWKFTLEQYEWISARAIQLLKGSTDVV